MRSRDPGRDASLEALVPALIGRLPHLLDEVRRLLTADWPDYAQFLAEEQAEVEVAAEGSSAGSSSSRRSTCPSRTAT
ncbi:hypothetical protein ACFQ1L_26425 [Phytohabitans flavus]|uniref:hypothetical protein n=1 Tax=Phytohabitans flavus TaxID=1076124 RepID=UPI003633F5A2